MIEKLNIAYSATLKVVININTVANTCIIALSLALKNDDLQMTNIDRV